MRIISVMTEMFIINGTIGCYKSYEKTEKQRPKEGDLQK